MWRTGCGQVSGEWDEQQKIGWCIEDPSRQQRPETDERKRRRSNNCFMDHFTGNNNVKMDRPQEVKIIVFNHHLLYLFTEVSAIVKFLLKSLSLLRDCVSLEEACLEWRIVVIGQRREHWQMPDIVY